LREAVNFFLEAMALDPDYAPAHAGLADACIILGSYGLMAPMEALSKAKAATLKVVGAELSLDKTEALPPGSRAATPIGDGYLLANPLIDRWVVADGRTQVVAIPGAALASDEQRLGEALFFTTLMAPGNPTDGARSSFTCETALSGVGLSWHSVAPGTSFPPTGEPNLATEASTYSLATPTMDGGSSLTNTSPI